MKKTVSLFLALVLALGICGAFAEETALPAYTWPGDDPVTAAVIRYMQETDFGAETPEGGVMIPTPIILKTAYNADETEATVWGNFWIFTYAPKGRILETGPCIENPGVLKLEKKDGGWTVVSAEFAEAGINYPADIVRFCGGDRDLEAQFALTRENSDDSILPQYQRAAVVEYAAANGLDIEAFRSPGWDPVSVNN